MDDIDRIPELEAMRMGTAYRAPVTIRGFSFQVRPISVGETLEIAEEVVERMKVLSEVARNRVTEHTMLSKLTLMRSSTSDVGATDFKIHEYLLDKMTPDELHFAFKQYVSICDRCNPCLEEMPVERLKELAEQVKKSPSEAIELSFLDLVNLARYLLTSVG